MSTDPAPRPIPRRALLPLILATALPSVPREAGAQPAAGTATRPLANAVTELGDWLLAELGLRRSLPSFALSPFNLHGTLALLALGAPPRQSAPLARSLGLDPARIDARADALARLRGLATAANGPEARISIGYSAWCRQTRRFEQPWRDMVRRAGGARLGRLDFASPSAAETVNAWSARATQGEIPRLVDRLPRDADLVLAGAVHFAGRWETPFREEATEMAPFHRLDGSTVGVPMMRQRLRAHHGTADGARILRLPYAGGRLAFWAAAAERVEDSAAFLARVAAAGPGRWLQAQALRAVEVEVTLPRFTLRAGGDVLPAIAAAESGRSLAGELRGVISRPVRLSEVQHHTRIRVFEEGTVAAAATAALASRGMRQTEEFLADRPFIFAIGPTAGWLPLFIGQVSDASQTLA
ncbi:serpin family protein [Falsiroseomonas stagni]|uniref:Serpin B n=1 Tax=Falsiroseomonas stagni DSM 19981 TaxID=1123062 RepID=A0A1I4F8T2_9PROT|nr:serpin family protein [Falsiroseomonas stagni]SFL13196.1 serpin B [Falsiroseomonas stagni DSM 19981]